MKALWVALLLSMPVAAQVAAGAVNPAPAASLQATPQQAPAHQQRLIVSTSEVADPVLGIRAHALGLERVVQMLQWSKPDPQGRYNQVWDSARLDSAGRDAAHQNIAEFPFNGERWWVSDAQIDGHPVAPDLLAALDKQDAWLPVTPDASQLPANLAATFQSDGAWLSTSQDNAHPQVGDVRIGWRAIANSPAPAGVALVAGRWVLSPESVASAAVASPGSAIPAPEPVRTTALRLDEDRQQPFYLDPNVWMAAAGTAFAMVLLAGLLRRRSKPAPAARARKPRKKKR